NPTSSPKHMTKAFRLIDSFSKKINAFPRNPRNYHKRGRLYFLVGRHDEAISDFDKAIFLDSGFHQAYCWRGAAKLQKGLIEDSLQDLNKSLAIARGYSPVYYWRAVNFNRTYKFEAADLDFAEAVRLKPFFAPYWVERGANHFNWGKYSRAL